MGKTGEPIRFLFDYISPFAYLAWTQIHALADRHGRDVEPIPVLFAGLLNVLGQKGPAEIVGKRIYMFKDVARRAHRLHIPLRPPASHPFNPLLALRVSSMPVEAKVLRSLVDAFFRAVWVRGLGITTPQEVAAIASEIGLDGERLVVGAQTPEIKARLRQQTEQALAVGAFGVPTMLVGSELFWGHDSLEPLDAYLRGDDPLTPELFAAWACVEPSASRF